MRRLAAWFCLLLIAIAMLGPRLVDRQAVERIVDTARHAIERIGPGALTVSGAATVSAVGARLLGREIRRRGNVRYEILPGRAALAEPHEIAKAMDGIAGILRPRARLHRVRLLGPEPLALTTLFDPATRSARFVLQAAPPVADAVVARLRAAYPGLRVRPLELCLPSHGLAVVRLKKRRRWLFSLQTGKDYRHAVMESLVHELCGLAAPALVQLVVTPAPAMIERGSARALRRRERRLRSQTAAAETEPGVDSAVAQKDIKGAVEGVGRSVFWFDLRVVGHRDGDVVHHLAAVLNEVRQDNELRPRDMRVRRQLYLRRIDLGLPPLLPGAITGAVSSAELAMLWQLPGSGVREALVHRARTRELPAGSAISRDPGAALVEDELGPLGLLPGDRRFGLAVLGGQGGGKTSILLRDVANAARDETRALILVDPKEDLARDALTVIPRSRTVHYLDLSKPYCGVNILALGHLSPQVRADLLISALRETAGADAIRSRSDEFLRTAATAVCAVEREPTLFHVRRMLDPFEPSYRDWVVRELAALDEVDFLLDYWQREFPATATANPRFVAEALNAPRNKLSRFLAVPSLALLVTHPAQLDLERVIDRREVVVVNGSKGAVGEDNAVLFGQMVVLLVQKTLHQLQRRERASRTAARLVIDEAHNFFTPSFATMLSEGRSAGLEVTCAFQYLGQIEDERVRAGVKSLLQNVCVTRVRELDDARQFATLAQDVYSDGIRADADDQRALTVDPLDIVNMPNHRALCLWLVDGKPQPAFHADTLPIERLSRSSDASERYDSHIARQRDVGSHPHDEGRAIGPPPIWSIGAPVQVSGREVRIDLAAWERFHEIGAIDEVVVTLGNDETGWHGFEALAAEGVHRRVRVQLPPSLPDGSYRVGVVIVDADRQVHDWEPASVVGRSRRPATVQLGS